MEKSPNNDKVIIITKIIAIIIIKYENRLNPLIVAVFQLVFSPFKISNKGKMKMDLNARNKSAIVIIPNISSGKELRNEFGNLNTEL
ncbi:MAG: hypothetical protein DRH57_09235 [Candidatus Cloacimonadota bacterium]|nr:MAG: hypothetical protein DRH57_09235 [Candidatus Cloacimonadota bacterium]